MMRIIEIEPLENGAHRNQNGATTIVPDGWAIVPADMEIPNTFPFVNIEVENGVVTSMEAGAVPVIKPTEEELAAEYEALAVIKIRERYSADDEYKVLREALAYPEDVDRQVAFVAYNEYVETCKAAAHAEVYGDEQ